MSAVVDRLNAALEGRYRIEGELGEGGMATVYLADDLRHERKVAVKVLRPELAAVVGAERFLAEIKTTANLQHPHILPLFDSGEADAFLFYVMPYVEGETLRQRLDREHQLGIDEALSLAKKVAGALDYAHGRGIVHRDIKPGNILLSRQGEPLVADFGIALAVAQAGGGRITETGLSLGTPHYMSPEQATGDRDVDPRSDVYALACVLYEMLAGEPPFSASTAQAILAKILTMDAPSITMVRRTVQPNVGAALAKALEKLPADRFATVADFAAALDDEGFRYRARTRVERAPAEVAVPAPGARGLPLSAQIGAAAALIALAAFGWLRPTPDLPAERVARFTFTPPETAPVSTTGFWRDVAVSPDGRFIAYVGPTADGDRPQLNLRALDDLQAASLRGTEMGHGPFFSPDGEWVGFTPVSSYTTLQRVSVLGGSPVTLTEAPTMIHGASWGSEEIVFGTMGGSLFRIPAGGGDPEAVTALDTDSGDREHVFPHIIEEGDAVLFTIVRAGSPLAGELAVLDLESGVVSELGIQGVNAQYVSTGHIVYAAEDRSLRAVPFDVASLTVTGSAVPLLDGIVVKGNGAADFDVSAGGELVYLPGAGGGSSERAPLWVDRAGEEEPIRATPLAYYYARLSPDGERLVLDEREGEGNIWIWSFSAGNQIRLSLNAGSAVYPVWSPNGDFLAYSSAESAHIYRKASNNTGDTSILLEDIRGEGSSAPEAYFFTPDGESVVLRQQASPETQDDLLMIPVGGDGAPVWRLAGDTDQRNAVLSPDGRWMAYQSRESGRFEVYVRPFPDVESDQVLVSNAGGEDPLWSPDGAELFYLEPGSPTRLVSVRVEADVNAGRFRFGERQALLDWPYFTGGDGRNYDVSSDGQRFVVIRGSADVGGSENTDIHVVLNWFEELRERMGSD